MPHSTRTLDCTGEGERETKPFPTGRETAACRRHTIPCASIAEVAAAARRSHGSRQAGGQKCRQGAFKRQVVQAQRTCLRASCRSQQQAGALHQVELFRLQVDVQQVATHPAPAILGRHDLQRKNNTEIKGECKRPAILWPCPARKASTSCRTLAGRARPSRKPANSSLQPGRGEEGGQGRAHASKSHGIKVCAAAAACAQATAG